MRKARNHWQETCAILAIVVGLGLTGISYADGFHWPDGEGPTLTSFLCNSSTSRWDCTNNFSDFNCVLKGSAGNPGSNGSLYICDNTIWNSVKLVQKRQYGLCNEGSGSCTEWGSYYCAYWNVYKDNNCSSDQLACSLWGIGSGFCDPNNP